MEGVTSHFELVTQKCLKGEQGKQIFIAQLNENLNFFPC